jgi:hypothetical protein
VSDVYTSLAEAVMRYAEAHYEDGGWDVLVECWTVEMLAESLEEYPPEPLTEEEAIDQWRTGVVAVWADREADARNSAFCSG